MLRHAKITPLNTCLTRKGGKVALAAAFVLWVGFAFSAAAKAATGYDSLDDPAISVKAPTQIELVAITRVNQRLFAVGEHGVILYSDDSGVSWRQATVPVDLLLTDIFFTSPKDGWAVGHYGVILHSMDGGLTWSTAITGLDVIKALDDASALSQANAAGTPQAALELRVATAYNKNGPSKPFLAVGGCAGGILAVGQQDMAMFSADDGKSWQQWTSNISDPQFYNFYAVVDEGNTTFLIGEGGTILKSTANCMNFTQVPGPYTATLFGGKLLSQGTILVYGLDGGLFLTKDDGKTWVTLNVPSDILIDSAVELPSGRILVGTLGGIFYLSDANITSFSRLAASEPFQISDMALAPDGNVIVVGNGGIAILNKQSIQ